ncbi:MAG: hypothetical protein IPH62_19430 [Ignavibacteriae bacterium]|nr:hypothetical protein [Ignavibacteriota bacterium]
MSKANEIKVLDGLEHIRKRPGMYIGSTENPNHLLREVLDNAIDEVINGYADTISLDFKKGTAIVCDNGRGFPIHEVTLPNGEVSDSVIAATCYLFSGSKFDDRAYEFSIGTHGVGLTAINALSTKMSMAIKKDKQIHHYLFEDAIFKDKKLYEANNWFSTRVEFEVDPQYFDSIDFNIEVFTKELLYLNAKYKRVKITINGKPLIKIDLDTYFKAIFKLDKSVPVFSAYYLDNETKEDIAIYFTYDKESEVKDPFGAVNLKFCGGTFLTTFATIYYNLVSKEFLNFDYITRSDILYGFKYFITISLKNPKYSSQDKTKMTTNISKMFDNIKSRISLLLRSEDFFKKIFKEIEEEKSNKNLSKLIKNTKGKRVSSDNPLIDCLDNPGDIIYILEGDSAAGTLKKIRKVKSEAILPINGKIINTFNNTKEKIVSGKFKYILEALGINTSDSLSKKDYRYKSVKLICDADPDGLHINVLLSIGIWKFAKDLIRQGRLSVILPPLYGAVKGKIFIPIYDKKDIDNYTKQSYTIKRFKGLGEMNPSELDYIIHNPIEYTILPPANSNDELLIEACITDTEIKKKLCLNNTLGFEHLISIIRK